MNKEKLETIFNDDLGTSYFPLLAEEYLSNGDYDRALKVLDTGLLLNPDNNDGKYIKINKLRAKIIKITQNGRSTFYCPYLQRVKKKWINYSDIIEFITICYY